MDPSCTLFSSLLNLEYHTAIVARNGDPVTGLAAEGVLPRRIASREGLVWFAPADPFAAPRRYGFSSRVRCRTVQLTHIQRLSTAARRMKSAILESKPVAAAKLPHRRGKRARVGIPCSGSHISSTNQPPVGRTVVLA